MKSLELIPLLRILDANANRAAEGLRVVEDYARFVLDDPHLSGCYKQLRHDLGTALLALAPLGCHAARDTQRDVGTALTTSQESCRQDLSGVVAANQKRVEQALRCLEEYTKPLQPATAARIEPLRYRAYTLGRAVQTTSHSLQRLAQVRLYVLVDAGCCPERFTAHVQALVAAGVDALQLREKRMADRQLLERARLLRRLTKGTPTLFLMNDRPDLAVLAEADGVHVGQAELPLKEVRTLVGPQRLIGVSTHSVEQARQAVLDGADYVGCGPVFPSPTKHFPDFPGLPLLRQVAAEIRLPAFAIGGVTERNLPQVLDTGFARIAVSGALTQAADPADQARRLRKLLPA